MKLDWQHFPYEPGEELAEFYMARVDGTGLSLEVVNVGAGRWTYGVMNAEGSGYVSDGKTPVFTVDEGKRKAVELAAAHLARIASDLGAESR